MQQFVLRPGRRQNVASCKDVRRCMRCPVRTVLRMKHRVPRYVNVGVHPSDGGRLFALPGVHAKGSCVEFTLGLDFREIGCFSEDSGRAEERQFEAHAHVAAAPILDSAEYATEFRYSVSTICPSRL